MTKLGVTTVEAKSGYGLAVREEIKILSVYRDLRVLDGAAVVPTFLGAHAVPREMLGGKQAYVDKVVNEMIPAVASTGLAVYCDMFIEEGAFDVADARRIARAAEGAGLGIKLHADQLTDGGGAALAAEIGAVSADHLEYASDTGIRRMAEAGVVGVLLPIASMYLGGPFANGRKMIDRGMDVAIATDFNPGSAPSLDLHLAMLLACTMCGLTPAEALKGATDCAARASGIDEDAGSLEIGKRANLVITDSESVDHWIYHFRPASVRAVYSGGQLVSSAEGTAAKATRARQPGA